MSPRTGGLGGQPPRVPATGITPGLDAAGEARMAELLDNHPTIVGLQRRQAPSVGVSTSGGQALTDSAWTTLTSFNQTDWSTVAGMASSGTLFAPMAGIYMAGMSTVVFAAPVTFGGQRISLGGVVRATQWTAGGTQELGVLQVPIKLAAGEGAAFEVWVDPGGGTTVDPGTAIWLQFLSAA